MIRRTGGNVDDLTIVRTPGSFEIPATAHQLARTGRFDAIICLGCLIRGETSHYDFIAAEVSRGIGRIPAETGVPVGFGVLTVENTEQALNRSGLKYGNKGSEAAEAAIEMARLFQTISEKKPRDS